MTVAPQPLCPLLGVLPQVMIGDTFDIAPASRIGRLRLRGTAVVTTRDERRVEVAVTGRCCGLKANARLTVRALDDGSLRIEAAGLPGLSLAITAAVRDARADCLELAVDADDAASIVVSASDRGIAATASGLRLGAVVLHLDARDSQIRACAA